MGCREGGPCPGQAAPAPPATADQQEKPVRTGPAQVGTRHRWALGVAPTSWSGGAGTEPQGASWGQMGRVCGPLPAGAFPVTGTGPVSPGWAGAEGAVASVRLPGPHCPRDAHRQDRLCLLTFQMVNIPSFLPPPGAHGSFPPRPSAASLRLAGPRSRLTHGGSRVSPVDTGSCPVFPAASHAPSLGPSGVSCVRNKYTQQNHHFKVCSSVPFSTPAVWGHFCVLTELSTSDITPNPLSSHPIPTPSPSPWNRLLSVLWVCLFGTIQHVCSFCKPSAP